MVISTKLPIYILIFYPFFSFITLSVIGLPPSLFLALITGFTFIQIVSQNAVIIHKYVRYYWLYLILVFFSTYLINAQPLLLDSMLFRLVLILVPILFYTVIDNTYFDKKFIKISVTLIKYLVYFAALVSIIQYFYPTFWIDQSKYLNYEDGTEGYTRRIWSIFTWGDFNSEQYIGKSFLVFYAILLHAYKGNRKVMLLVQISVTVVVFLSQMRFAIVNYIIVSVFMLYNKVSISRLLNLSIAVFIFYYILSLLTFDFNYFFENRLMSDSALTRIDAFSAFWYAYPDNPWFGTGGVRTEKLFEGYGHVAQIHNAHLRIAFYYGVFAFITHSLFLYYLAKKTFRTLKKTGYSPPFVGMLIYLFATFTQPSAYLLEPGLIIMFVFDKYYNDMYKYDKQELLVNNKRNE